MNRPGTSSGVSLIVYSLEFLFGAPQAAGNVARAIQRPMRLSNHRLLSVTAPSVHGVCTFKVRNQPTVWFYRMQDVVLTSAEEASGLVQTSAPEERRRDSPLPVRQGVSGLASDSPHSLASTGGDPPGLPVLSAGQ
jgi:hypothetical protein